MYLPIRPIDQSKHTERRPMWNESMAINEIRANRPQPVNIKGCLAWPEMCRSRIISKVDLIRKSKKLFTRHL